MKVIVSAPGKIHLMGEHAVVYGKPAFLTAINRRLTVTIESAESGTEILTDTAAVRECVEYSWQIIQSEYHLQQLPPLRFSLTSDIAFGYHLGSSAALAVATIGATIYFVKQLWNPIEINRLAYEVEKKHHGNPSGGDNTAVTFGGFLWYRRELEFLKSLWQLPFRLPDSVNHFFLINTGKPKESTREMIEMVAQYVQADELKMEHIFNENEKQTRTITAALKAGHETEVVTSMKKGEATLEQMGVVSEKVLPLIRAVEQQGGAVKILGGGGKQDGVGFLLAYHRDPAVLAAVCQSFGYPIDPILLAEEGVRLEKGKTL